MKDVEEERKPLVSMLGKVYITSNSSTEKLQAVRDLVSEALDSKIAPDATARNALSKVYQALSKALEEVDLVRPSIVEEAADHTVAEKAVDVEGGSDVEESKMEVAEEQGITRGQDTLLDELLDDEDEDEDI